VEYKKAFEDGRIFGLSQKRVFEFSHMEIISRIKSRSLEREVEIKRLGKVMIDLMIPSYLKYLNWAAENNQGVYDPRLREKLKIQGETVCAKSDELEEIFNIAKKGKIEEQNIETHASFFRESAKKVGSYIHQMTAATKGMFEEIKRADNFICQIVIPKADASTIRCFGKWLYKV
jgi:hypothetical protein